MAGSKLFALPIFALIYVARVAAIQMSTSRSQASENGGGLCISLLAYEDPEWIDFLIANVLRFTDCSTRVAIHLNSMTNYSDEDIAKFNSVSQRVTVNPERITVEFFRLSILHAHVLNAKHMQQLWGNQCNTFAMQASNQLWIKPGVEPYVEEFGMSGMIQRGYLGCDGFCINQHWDVAHRAWSQPEGTFVPMRLMASFISDYTKWYDGECEPHGRKDCLKEYCGREEDWLQTYACNHEYPQDTLQLKITSQDVSEDTMQLKIASHAELPPTCARAGPTLCMRFAADKRLGVADVEKIIEHGDPCQVDERTGNFTPYYQEHQDFCKSTGLDKMAPFTVKINAHGRGPQSRPSDTHDPDGPLAKWLDLSKTPHEDLIISYIMNLTYAQSFVERRPC